MLTLQNVSLLHFQHPHLPNPAQENAKPSPQSRPSIIGCFLSAFPISQTLASYAARLDVSRTSQASLHLPTLAQAAPSMESIPFPPATTYQTRLPILPHSV